MIKAPHWKWYVPGYFFIAGIAAGVAFFGALARFFGGRRHRVTVRHARYLALALSIICPVLLILDLGTRHGASSACCASSRCARRSASARGF